MANIGLIGDDPLPIGAQVPSRPDTEPTAPATPSWGDTLGASWRQDNLIGSVLNRKDLGVSNEMEPGYKPWDEIKDDPKYRDRWESFVDVNNPRMMVARKSQIDMEDNDRRTLAAAGWRGMLTSLGAGIADPTILVPGAGYIKAVKGGYSVSRAALDVAIGGALGAAAQEAGLQATQETRPWEDSAIAIGGGFVLGGLLGGGARLLSRGEARSAETALRTLHRASEVGPGGLVVASGSELADIATRVRAGERVPSNEVVEAARVASLQARSGRELTPEVQARVDTIDRLAQEVERETVRARSIDIETGVRQAFGSDGARILDQGGVKVVQSVEDLPARADGQAHPADVRGVFDGEKAYLVADNVAPEEVKGVLLHEVGVHYGMERMVGPDNFRVLADDIMARAQAGEARFAEALAAVPKDTPAQHVAEEALAYLVEHAPEVGVVQRVISAVKQFIRQAFGGRFSGLSEEDIRALAVSALRKWKPEGGPADLRYSRGHKFTQDDPGGLKKGEKFFDIHDADGNNIASMYVKIDGDTLRINDVYRPYGAGKSNSLGPSQVRGILADFLEQHPEIKRISGDRVTGARAGLDDAAREALVQVRYSRGGTRNERIAQRLDALSKAIDSIDDPAAFASAMGRLSAGGADVAQQFTLEDLSPAGRAGGAWARMTSGLNPILRSNQRAIPAARQYAQQLVENTIFQNAHFQDQTLGASVETMARTNYRSRIIAAGKAHDAIYAEMRKAGIQMSARDFEEGVAKAMRRGDVGENEFISRAAEAYRKEMFDPFKVEAQKTLGSDGKPLLPEDLEVVGAESYLTRVPNYEKLTADELGFKTTVANYYEGVFRNEFKKDATAIRNRIAALDKEIDDLRMTPEARVQAMDAIEARLAEMEQQNAREIDLLTQINQQRTAAVKAGERGDKRAAKAAREEAARLFEQGGDGLKAFLKERSALRQRQRRIDLNYAGMQERSDRIAQTIADIEESNLRAMNRLIDRGQKAEREMAKLDPALKAEKIAALRTQFADVAARSEKAAERLSAQADKIVRDEIAALQKAMKERQAGGMREALAGTVEAKAATAKTAAEKKLAEDIKANAKAEQARAERLNSIARRLEEAEALDPDGQMVELRRALNEVAAMTSGTSLDRGAKAQRLMDRAKALDPTKLDERVKTIETMKRDMEQEFYAKWAQRRGGEGVDIEAGAQPRFQDYAADVARQIFDHYTGRSANSGTVPDFAVPLASGPLKERTFKIPDKLIEPWLENDIRAIAERYGRTMAAQIELTRKFGRADMRDQFFTLNKQYMELREHVGLASTAEEAMALLGKKPGTVEAFNAWRRGQDINTATKQNILAFLAKDEKGAVEDLTAMRDLLLGRYKMEEARSDYAKLTRGLLAFNYVRAMGGAVIANLGDLYRSAMVHGLGRFMNDGIKPLVSNLEGFRASVKEAQLAGQVGEKWLHNRMATFAEIGDPYAKGTQIERFMENASRFASKWNGLSLFTDFSKSIASVTTQNRILEVVGTAKDTPYLRYLGIDKAMEGRIKEQFAAHGQMMDGLRVAGTENWTDAEAVRAYRAAVSKDVDSITVERSVGDVPLFANSPTGKLILQFRTYNLAANQRVLLRGLQESPARFVGSVVAMATIGMLVSTLRSWRGGEERWEKFKTSAENPGFLIGEGLDNSGIFTVPFEIANTVEKLTQPSGFSFNPIKRPLMAAFPGKSQQGESTRFAARDPLGAILGPSAGLPLTAAKALGGDAKAIQQMIPYSTYPGMREAIQAMTGDSPYDF